MSHLIRSISPTARSVPPKCTQCLPIHPPPFLFLSPFIVRSINALSQVPTPQIHLFFNYGVIHSPRLPSTRSSFTFFTARVYPTRASCVQFQSMHTSAVSFTPIRHHRSVRPLFKAPHTCPFICAFTYSPTRQCTDPSAYSYVIQPFTPSSHPSSHIPRDQLPRHLAAALHRSPPLHCRVYYLETSFSNSNAKAFWRCTTLANKHSSH
jgi:hypothetical protein